jgi:hypothetical protein
MDQVQILLPLLAAVRNRRQQLRIVSRKARQQLGVVAVVLRHAGSDGGNLARVGHDHLVAQPGQQPADPGRVRAGFHSDAQLRLAFKMPPQSGLGALHAPFLDHIAIPVQQTVMAIPVAQIQTHRHLRLRLTDFRLPRHFANLLHWLVSSLAPRVRCGQITCTARPAVSSHL